MGFIDEAKRASRQSTREEDAQKKEKFEAEQHSKFRNAIPSIVSTARQTTHRKFLKHSCVESIYVDDLQKYCAWEYLLRNATTLEQELLEKLQEQEPNTSSVRIEAMSFSDAVKQTPNLKQKTVGELSDYCIIIKAVIVFQPPVN